ncbi:membrane protein [Aliidongia dinghuensis]|uniref:Membrane protein n=1 Tax=Aliidongia dinghuensis TaxID=1867774 RepID=A0A8J2YPM7_9PROT|nr:lipid A deacylase LpxR family protein [Aliidongia dinghuensis]GGF05181.1 membrane protein [Aliidongia dinghuensis]
MSKVTGAAWGASLLATGLLVAASPARAEPAADPTSIWTLSDENSSITTSKLNDKYYVNGLKLGWTSPTDAVPHFIASIGHSLFGEGQQRLSLDVSQSIYTPADTLAVPPDPKDRPYAGVLLLGATLLQDTDDTRQSVGLQLGLVGPDAEAEQVQNGFHDVIGYGHTKGWAYQLRDEPLAELLGQKIWRVPLGTVGGFETDALPQIEGGLGNLRVYGLGGSIFRVGQGLDADFGAARLRPGLSGSDAYHATRNFGWYFFVGADGQAVVHDVTIDGNDFRNSATASRMPFVGELEAGVAFLAYGMRISYTQVVQTEQVYGQHGGPHQFGSLTLSAHF